MRFEIRKRQDGVTTVLVRPGRGQPIAPQVLYCRTKKELKEKVAAAIEGLERARAAKP